MTFFEQTNVQVHVTAGERNYFTLFPERHSSLPVIQTRMQYIQPTIWFRKIILYKREWKKKKVKYLQVDSMYKDHFAYQYSNHLWTFHISMRLSNGTLVASIPIVETFKQTAKTDHSNQHSITEIQRSQLGYLDYNVIPNLFACRFVVYSWTL